MTSKMYSPQLFNRLVNNEPHRKSQTPTVARFPKTELPKLQTPQPTALITPIDRRFIEGKG